MQPGAALLVPGDHLDRYEVLFEIARGGMAAVYAARRAGTRAFDRVLALKVPLPHLRSERRYVDLFLNEAKIASVIDHPNVVQVFDLGEHDGVPYLVMEYVRGRALAQVLERVHAHDVRLLLALEVLAFAAEGLHAAHIARGPDGLPLGIVHRDVSPQNVLVAYAGQVKVADFGIAHAHDRPVMTRTGELRGKLQYLAPEQISREEPVSARTDLWSLGVIIWEVIMQRALFLGASDAETLWNVCAKTCPPIELPAFLGATPLASVVAACLSRRPGERPSSAAELAEALREVLRQGGRSVDVAQTMSTAFAAEIAEDNERLAAAFARGGAPSMESAATTDGPEARRSLPRGRHVSRKTAWALASLICGAGAVAWMLQRPTLGTNAAQAPAGSVAATLVAAPPDVQVPAIPEATRDARSGPALPGVSAASPSAAMSAPSAGAAASAPGVDGRRITAGRVPSALPPSALPRSPLLGNPYAAPAGSR